MHTHETELCRMRAYLIESIFLMCQRPPTQWAPVPRTRAPPPRYVVHVEGRSQVSVRLYGVLPVSIEAPSACASAAMARGSTGGTTGGTAPLPSVSQVHWADS